MAITRLSAPSITGLTIPNTSINNASLSSVTALPSGVGGKVVAKFSNSMYTTITKLPGHQVLQIIGPYSYSIYTYCI